MSACHRAWPPKRKDDIQLSVTLALPEAAASASFEEVPLHVFFPTLETIGAPFLIHASFGLTANRNYFRRGEQDDALLKVLAELAQEAALAIPAEHSPVSNALQTSPAPRSRPSLTQGGH